MRETPPGPDPAFPDRSVDSHFVRLGYRTREKEIKRRRPFRRPEIIEVSFSRGGRRMPGREPPRQEPFSTSKNVLPSTPEGRSRGIYGCRRAPRSESSAGAWDAERPRGAFPRRAWERAFRWRKATGVASRSMTAAIWLPKGATFGSERRSMGRGYVFSVRVHPKQAHSCHLIPLELSS